MAKEDRTRTRGERNESVLGADSECVSMGSRGARNCEPVEPLLYYVLYFGYTPVACADVRQLKVHVTSPTYQLGDVRRDR
jgi:hypothetical protein